LVVHGAVWPLISDSILPATRALHSTFVWLGQAKGPVYLVALVFDWTGGLPSVV
jgi:hypothetical protein